MVYKNIKKFFTNLGNELRDDFQFFHTFEREAREHYNLEAGSIVIFHSERFHTKYEDKYKVFHKVTSLSICVSRLCKRMGCKHLCVG